MTILELLVVMLLLAIASGGVGLVVPRILGAAQLETALHQLAADLRQARTLAVASAGRVRLVLRAGENGYVRQSTAAPDLQFVPDGAATGFTINETRRLPTGITIARVGSGGTLTFTPLGNAENATIVLENVRGTQRALVLNQRGRIRIDPTR